MRKPKGSANPFQTPNAISHAVRKSKDTVWKPKDTLHLFLNPRALIFSFRKHSYHCEPLIFLCHLATSSLHNVSPSLSIQHPTPRISLQSTDPRPTFHFWHDTTRGTLLIPSLSRTSRQRASSARVPRDFPFQATEAPQIPPSKGGAPTSPSSPALQRRYETRRLPTTPGVTTSRPESSMRRPPAKRAGTSSPGESSRALQPKSPVATHARAPADFELPFNMSLESIIRRPMLTASPIEGNSDCRARPFHSELYFDQEAMWQQPEI